MESDTLYPLLPKLTSQPLLGAIPNNVDYPSSIPLKGTEFYFCFVLFVWIVQLESLQIKSDDTRTVFHVPLESGLRFPIVRLYIQSNTAIWVVFLTAFDSIIDWISIAIRLNVIPLPFNAVLLPGNLDAVGIIRGTKVVGDFFPLFLKSWSLQTVYHRNNIRLS